MEFFYSGLEAQTIIFVWRWIFAKKFQSHNEALRLTKIFKCDSFIFKICSDISVSDKYIRFTFFSHSYIIMPLLKLLKFNIFFYYNMYFKILIEISNISFQQYNLIINANICN